MLIPHTLPTYSIDRFDGIAMHVCIPSAPSPITNPPMQVNTHSAEGMSIYSLCRMWVRNDPDVVLDGPLPPVCCGLASFPCSTHSTTLHGMPHTGAPQGPQSILNRPSTHPYHVNNPATVSTTPRHCSNSATLPVGTSLHPLAPCAAASR